MPSAINRDYSGLDRPEINRFLFYPRRSTDLITDTKDIREVMIQVACGGELSSLWAETGQEAASILFFHGNGEIASEYMDIAGLFLQMNIRFICVDYRGYGKSFGAPAAGSMVSDAHDVFEFVFSRLHKKPGPLIVMGRSLGCVSALEIAAFYADRIDGLIIESGFAESLQLFRTLGINTDYLPIKEEDCFGNREKIKSFLKPLLIIHAENDYLIPIEQAEKLFSSAGSPQKKILRIARAGHNDIFFAGMENYLTSVIELMKTAANERTISKK